jgi:hypothetical protein
VKETVRSTAADIHFLGYRITEPQPDFYPRTAKTLVPCSGYEHGTPDFHSALELLNHELNLHIDPLDRLTFSLMLTGLSGAKRFGGDLHISPIMGENSAAHTLHSIVLATELLRRSGLLAAERQDSGVIQLRVSLSLGLLTHDMGEILGELSSLAQRAAKTSLTERPDLERMIFKIALTEAFRATSAHPARPASFYAFLRDMRHAAGIGCGDAVSETDDRLLGTIRHYESIQAQAPLSFEIQGRIERYLRFYDLAEMKGTVTSAEQLFIGNAVKVIEHLQGLRHLLRFVTVAPIDKRPNLLFPGSLPSAPRGHWVETSMHEMLPLRYASNYRIYRSLLYMESELSHLFKAATASHEKSFAETLRDALYTTQAEWMSVSRPLFDRTVRSESTELIELIRRHYDESSVAGRAEAWAAIRKHLTSNLVCDFEKFRALRSSEDSRSRSHLLPVESRKRLVSLYLEAVRTKYVPEDETPLVLLQTLPETLRAFDCRASTSRP